MKTKLKSILQLKYLVPIFFTIKLIAYYSLIEVNIFTNPLVLSSTFVFGILFIALCQSNLRWKKQIFFCLYTFFSIIMFSDTMYYNYYNQTVSIKQIWQAANVAKVPSSFVDTLIPASFLLLLDIPILYSFFKKKSEDKQFKNAKWKKFIPVTTNVIVLAVLVLAVNPFGSKLISKMNSVEFFTNHISDIYSTVAEKVYAKEIPPEEVLETVEEIVEEPVKDNLNGIAKGKNLILIQLEAVQNFVIGKSYNGQEITPNINKLISEDSLYFDNYYSLIGKGNTVDAEFTTLNSLYPVIDGESYRLYMDNDYNGLPWLLRDKGYSTFAIHGYEGQFWNRENAYPYQGIEEFYSMEDLDQSEKIGLGISDKSLFAQSIPIIKEQKQPFFSFMITLTNHHPFILEEDKSTLILKEEDKDTKFGNYLKTVRYTDEAIGQLIEDLKKEGLYEDTVIALYGDHHGLNCKMEEVQAQMEQFIGRPYDFDEMLRIPLVIHIPGSNVERTVHTLGGQIDFLPTIANLMDLQYEQPYVLGQDLVNATEGFVAFTAYLFNGSFAANNVMFEISREGVFDGSRAFEIGTGRELPIESYEDEYERALKIKEMSREILDQNLISEYIHHEVPLKQD